MVIRYSSAQQMCDDSDYQTVNWVAIDERGRERNSASEHGEVWGLGRISIGGELECAPPQAGRVSSTARDRGLGRVPRPRPGGACIQRIYGGGKLIRTGAIGLKGGTDQMSGCRGTPK